MARFWTWSSLALLLAAGFARAEERKYYSPIVSLQDEREVQKINANFKRQQDFDVTITSPGWVVGSAQTISTYTFKAIQQDTKYMVFAQPSWDTTTRILQKTTTGFMVQHAVPGSNGQTLDVAIVR